jgi:dTDP-glucose 4,6-dehydratase
VPNLTSLSGTLQSGIAAKVLGLEYRPRVHSWDGRQVLVTGGGGFIGGHLSVALNRAGANVRAFCRYNSRADRGTLDWFSPTEIAGIEIAFGDLRDPESVQRAVAGAEIVFHLGAQIAIPYSFINPRDFVETNVVGTLNIAQAALQTSVERLVHVSTSEVYGQAETLPITERHPLAPRSPYAASKAAADMLMMSFHRGLALPLTIARPFNTYGPHQSARAIVPTIIVQALRGSRLELGSMEPRRDLLFVRDTVAGLMAVAGARRALGRTLQLGTGHDVSVGELVALVGELVGRELDVDLDPQRIRPVDSEIGRLQCDRTELSSVTGWEPEVDLHTGVAETVAWFRSHQHRYREEYAT